MRIALLQIDTTVGAFAENARAILEQSERAADAGADLALFPELTLCGYPPKDLLALREFVDRQMKALEELARSPVFSRVPALVGFAEPHPGEGAGLFNACALLTGGKIAAGGRKKPPSPPNGFCEARPLRPSPGGTGVGNRGAPRGGSLLEGPSS